MGNPEDNNINALPRLQKSSWEPPHPHQRPWGTQRGSQKTEVHSPLRLSSSIGTIVAGGPVLANLQSIKIKKEVISDPRERSLGFCLFVCFVGCLFFKTSQHIQHTEDKYH